MENYINLLIGHYTIYFNAHKVNQLMKNILINKILKGDLEKKIDLDDADIFDEVNNDSDNEDLHILKRLGKTHSMGDGNVFRASNNATVLKIGIPKNVQNLDVVEVNNGELAFGYDHQCGFKLISKIQQVLLFQILL